MLKTHRISQGEAASFRVPLLLGGAPEPVAGWQLVTTIDADPATADDAAFTASAGNGRVTVLDASTWLVEVPEEQSAALAAGLYFFAHVATAPDGRTHLLERGRFIVEPKLS